MQRITVYGLARSTLVSCMRKERGGVFGMGDDKLQTLKDMSSRLRGLQSELKNKELLLRDMSNALSSFEKSFNLPCLLDFQRDLFEKTRDVYRHKIQSCRDDIRYTQHVIEIESHGAYAFIPWLTKAVESACCVEKLIPHFQLNPTQPAKAELRTLRAAMKDVSDNVEQVQEVHEPEFDLSICKKQAQECKTLYKVLAALSGRS